MDAAEAAEQLPGEASGRPQRNPPAAKGKKKRQPDGGEEGPPLPHKRLAEGGVHVEDCSAAPPPEEAPEQAPKPAACAPRRPAARARKSTKAAAAAAAQQEWLLGQDAEDEEAERQPRKRARAAACRARGARVRAPRGPRAGGDDAQCQGGASQRRRKAGFTEGVEAEGVLDRHAEGEGADLDLAQPQLGLSAVRPPAPGCALPRRESAAPGAEATWQMQGYSALPQVGVFALSMCLYSLCMVYSTCYGCHSPAEL